MIRIRKLQKKRDETNNPKYDYYIFSLIAINTILYFGAGCLIGLLITYLTGIFIN
mgnify:CR=1 FL=1